MPNVPSYGISIHRCNPHGQFHSLRPRQTSSRMLNNTAIDSHNLAFQVIHPGHRVPRPHYPESPHEIQNTYFLCVRRHRWRIARSVGMHASRMRRRYGRSFCHNGRNEHRRRHEFELIRRRRKRTRRNASDIDIQQRTRRNANDVVVQQRTRWGGRTNHHVELELERFDVVDVIEFEQRIGHDRGLSGRTRQRPRRCRRLCGQRLHGRIYLHGLSSYRLDKRRARPRTWSTAGRDALRQRKHAGIALHGPRGTS